MKSEVPEPEAATGTLGPLTDDRLRSIEAGT
jgi:hypothetical protein